MEWIDRNPVPNQPTQDSDIISSKSLTLIEEWRTNNPGQFNTLTNSVVQLKSLNTDHALSRYTKLKNTFDIKEAGLLSSLIATTRVYKLRNILADDMNVHQLLNDWLLTHGADKELGGDIKIPITAIEDDSLNKILSIIKTDKKIKKTQTRLEIGIDEMLQLEKGHAKPNPDFNNIYFKGNNKEAALEILTEATQQANMIIRLSGNLKSSQRHSVAVYTDGNKYHYFDPNRAVKECDTVEEVYQAINRDYLDIDAQTVMTMIDFDHSRYNSKIISNVEDKSLYLAYLKYSLGDNSIWNLDEKGAKERVRAQETEKEAMKDLKGYCDEVFKQHLLLMI